MASVVGTRRTPKGGTRSAAHARRAGAGRGSAAGVALVSTGNVYAGRMERVAKAMAGEHAGACFLVTNPADVAYCTGFLGGDSYLLLPVSGSRSRAVVISDFRYEEELQPLRDLCDIVIRRGSIVEAVGEVLSQHKARVCCVQADHLTVADFDSLAGAAKKAGGCKLAPTKGLIARLRAVKDAQEVSLIRAAIRLQEAALEAVLPTLRPGQQEIEIAAALESEMKRRGSSSPAFETIIAAGANGSLPHYRPGVAKTGAGRTLLVDWGAVHKGYRGDMTRTFSFGKWPAKMAEVYDIVLEAHERAAAGLRVGVSTRAVDTLARGFIAEKGFGERFGHGLGHGLGLNTHEGPRLHHLPSADEPLRAGMVVTIEPGVYLPGVGGVRIEDDYLVTEKGSENLCGLAKSREWATL